MLSRQVLRSATRTLTTASRSSLRIVCISTCYLIISNSVGVSFQLCGGFPTIPLMLHIISKSFNAELIN